ncbi:hypothetical protein BJ875DRAFT_527461, partial [Amylocarpus encephaloides]
MARQKTNGDQAIDQQSADDDLKITVRRGSTRKGSRLRSNVLLVVSVAKDLTFRQNVVRCQGSFREFPLPNLGILIIIDFMLTAAVIFMKLRNFYISRLQKENPVNQKPATFYTQGLAAFRGARPFRVRENILHSARIRLPQSWSDNEIQNPVDILLNCLQLDHVKNSLVGSPGAPVISGGQRKRVSIGMELAAAPMALYLDDPTSGLDATAAASIMSTLKVPSRLGMTIVVVIHQPRPEIFESLDSLVLLGKGQMIYQEHYGLTFPPSSNPADIMDIIAGEGHHFKLADEADVSWLIEQWTMNHPSTALDKASTISASKINLLTSTIKQRGAPFYRQMWVCFQRSLLQQYRMKSSFFFEMGVGAISGFLIGLAQLSAKGDNFSGIFNDPYQTLSSSVSYPNVPQMSLLVGLAIGLTASAPGVKIFGEEKLVFWREAAAGHNRFSYYTGKVFSTIPRMILANFHFTTFFMLLTTPCISFAAAFACNLLYFYCIYGLASILSMLTSREDGPLLATMSSLIVGVLNRMSPTLHKVRSWHMQWLWRASPGTWLTEAYFTQNLSPL